MHQFNAKDCEIKGYALYIGNISKDFAINNMKEKLGLQGIVKVFSINYNAIANILDTIDKRNIKQYMEIYKKIILL